MMRLSDEAIAEFRALHRKHYGTDLTEEEAERDALALIKLVATIQPLPPASPDGTTTVEQPTP